MTIEVRSVTPSDMPMLFVMMRELAEYEGVTDSQINESVVHAVLFCENPHVFAHVLEDTATIELVAYAFWDLTFSTWSSVQGMHVNDLYVRPEHRNNGYGSLLLKSLARICEERNLQRMDWAVLSWNTRALEFYESLGAQALTDRHFLRLDGNALHAAASNPPQ